MFSNGIKSANQIQVQTEDGVPVVPVAGDDGALKVGLKMLLTVAIEYSKQLTNMKLKGD